MKTVYWIVPVFLLVVGGCAPVQHSAVPSNKTPVLHKYELLVVDTYGVPLEGANIDYELKIGINVTENLTRKGSCTTTDQGLLGKIVNITEYPIRDYYFSKSSDKFLDVYRSELNYRVSKLGYSPKSGTMSANYATKQFKVTTEKGEVALIKSLEYFGEKFASTLSGFDLKKRILSFIGLIALQGLLTDSILELRSVDLESELLTFRDDYNGERVHSSLDGLTPGETGGNSCREPLELAGFRWQPHCRRLYQLPAAA